MTPKTRSYAIQINGIEESINAVDSLNKKLESLEERMNALSKVANVKVSAGDDTAKENLKVQKDLSEVEGDVVKKLEEQKQLRKQITQEAKEALAAERLSTGGYGNTMAGLKQELADIKAVMQHTDLGSSEFQELTKRAGELTSKLKELETAYGQWGRNVGNYTSAFDGLSEITVKVGDTERVFSSVREASRELGNELKSMVINGKEDTEQFKLLSDAVHDFEMASQRANSALEDMKKSSSAMDNLLDTFESFGALGSIAGGMKAFLGFDDAEIQKSIQSLVALQNVLKGIETLNKQINTQEGLGKYLANSNKQIDQFIAKITGAQVAEKGLVASTTAGTVAVKAFSAALKGIGLGLLMGGITLAVQGIQKLVGAIQNWIKGNADLVKSEELVKQSVERSNEALEERKKALQQSYLSGAISEEEYLRRSAEATSQAIREQIALINQLNAKEVKQIFSGGAEDSSWGFDYDVKGLEESTRMLELFGRALEENKDIVSSMRDHWDELTDAEKRMAEVGSTTLSTVSDTKDEFAKLSQTVGGQLIQEYQKAMDIMAVDTKKGEEALRRLYEQLNDNKWMQAALFNLPQYIPNEQVAARMQGLVNIIRNGMNQIQTAANADLGQLMIDAMKDGLDKTLKQIDRNEQLELQQYKGNQEAIRLVQQKYANQRQAAREAENKKQLSTVKKGNNQILEAEKQLTKLRIQNMAEGLSKRLTEIDSEYNIEYNAIKQRGERVNELLRELDKKRENDRKKALEEYRKDTEKEYAKLTNDLYQIEQNNLNKIRDYQDKNLESLKRRFSEQVGQGMMYSNAFEYPTNGQNEMFENSAMTRRARQYQELEHAVKRLDMEISGLTLDMKKLDGVGTESANFTLKQISERLKDLQKEREAAQKFLDENENKGAGTDAKKNNNEVRRTGEGTIDNDDIQSTLDIRLELYKGYYAQLKMVTTQSLINESVELAEWYKHESGETKAHFDQLLEEEDKFYQKRLENAKDSGEDEAKIVADHKEWMKRYKADYEKAFFALEREFQGKQLENMEGDLKKEEEIYANYYATLIQEVRDYHAAANAEEARADEVGVFSPKEIQKRIDDSVKAYEHGLEKLKKIMEELSSDRKMGKINSEDFQQSLREIMAETESFENNIKTSQTRLASGEDWGNMFSEIDKYTQLVGQGLNDIMNSVWQAQDSAFNRMMEDLNKQIEAQEEAYQKQQEITQQYAENVNAIEDELSNSRGDRRQELIDQLNDQMEAQRASIAEEKRIENEKKALERKAEQEDLKQKKRQHKRDLIQATINGALAVSNALTTKPFIPMALIAAGIAAATSAVQIALIAKQKYARGGQLEGGQLEGKSHAQGGIPVGNTGIEVEGKEYIIRKESTQPNIGLLDYINNSKRKLTLEDFIDYYDKPSKIRQNVSKMKFADGGIMPNVETTTRRGSGEIIDAIDRLANRPYYVSVAEINNVQDRVGRVQALAGRE